MGYETGSFIDEKLGECHVERTFGKIIVHNYNELQSPLHMKIEEAMKLYQALAGAFMYDYKDDSPDI